MTEIKPIMSIWRGDPYAKRGFCDGAMPDDVFGELSPRFDSPDPYKTYDWPATLKALYDKYIGGVQLEISDGYSMHNPVRVQGWELDMEIPNWEPKVDLTMEQIRECLVRRDAA